MNKASLQSACCCSCLTQSSHEHFIWIKEHVCTFTGCLTTLSSSARRFLSSHASPKAARQVPMILFSHEGTKFQVDFKKKQNPHTLGHSEMCYWAFVRHGAWRCFASGMKRYNTKECKVRPHHDTHTHIHIVCWPAQGGFCAQIPCQHLTLKPLTELLADPNITETRYDLFIFIFSPGTRHRN